MKDFVLASLVLTTFAGGQTQFAELGKHHLPKDMEHTHAVALGDVDGDGDLDLVCGNEGQNRLYLNDGKGTFTDATARLPTYTYRTDAVALGDVDGDGDLDLVLGNGGQNRLYLNDGKGTFTDATTRLPKHSAQTEAVALGDLDGDGDLDLVFGDYGQNRLYLNDGKGTFTDATAARLPKHSDGTFALALGDVDGDRDLDMVCGNIYVFQSRLYLNDGKGTFTDATARLPKHIDTAAVALGDVDGDKDLDLVFGIVQSASSHPPPQNRLYLNDGKGTFTDATTRLPKNSRGTVAVALGDLDGDGDLDLVSGSYGQSLYLNDGKGTFTDATAARLPKTGTNAVALGDVDGDKDLDLVFADGCNTTCWPMPPNRLYLNLHRQVHAPLPAIVGRNYQLDFYLRPGYAPSGQFVVPYMNLAELTTPLNIEPFGWWRLGLAGLQGLPPQPLPAPSGKVSLLLAVPNDVRLAGRTLFTQALAIYDLTKFPTWRFTNAMEDKIQ